MRALIAEGLAPAEAARQVRSAPAPAPPAAPTRSPDDEARRLREAIEAYDEETANAVLDRALAGFTLDVFTGAVVLPAMAMIGRGWSRGEVSVAQEHFATYVVRGRLVGLARGWGSGVGPLALLACPAGELHDLGLIVFGLALRNRGWRIAFLGPDTPADTLADAARRLRPAAVVISSPISERLSAAEDGLREVAGLAPVWIGGEGADEELARRTGVRLLPGRPTEAAASLAGEAVPAIS